jgi:hypothetical protein
MSQRIADLTLESLINPKSRNSSSVLNQETTTEILQAGHDLKTRSLQEGVQIQAAEKANLGVKRSIKWLATPPKPKASPPPPSSPSPPKPSPRKAGTFRSPLRNIHNDPWKNRPSAAPQSPFEKSSSEVLSSLRSQISNIGDALVKKRETSDRSRSELEAMRAKLEETSARRAAPRTGKSLWEDQAKKEEEQARVRRSGEAVGFATQLVKKITSPVLQGRSGAGGGAAYDLSFLSGLGGASPEPKGRAPSLAARMERIGKMARADTSNGAADDASLSTISTQ